MKKIAQIMKYDKASFAEHGFETEQQKAAACCIAELMEEIRQCGKQKFGMMIYFITEADMLGDRPVTIWSGLPIGTQRKLFEDYVLNRLKMKEVNEQHQPRTEESDER